MPSARRSVLTSLLAIGLTLVAVAAFAQPQPETFFKKKMGLSDAEIQQIRQGQIVTKVLPAGDTKYGVLVLGAVYVNAPVEKFAPVYKDVSRLRKLKVYLDLQTFSVGGAPVKLSDFDRVTINRKDVDDLKDCTPGDCDLQLANVESVRKQIKWGSPEQYDQANKVARQAMFELTQRYQSGGLKSFANYEDRGKPFNRFTETKAMLDNSFYLQGSTAPDVYRHIVEYPQGKVAGAEEFFYWENIDFGQGPTIRVSHNTIFPMGAGPAKPVAVNKQLYASRYIRTALMIFACVPDTQGKGFYLIEINDSRTPDFGSMKLSIVRKIATSTAEQSVKDMLALYKAEVAK
jgi:hypothetical protein